MADPDTDCSAGRSARRGKKAAPGREPAIRATAHALLDLVLDHCERAGTFGDWSLTGPVANGQLLDGVTGQLVLSIDPRRLV